MTTLLNKKLWAKNSIGNIYCNSRTGAGGPVKARTSCLQNLLHGHLRDHLRMGFRFRSWDLADRRETNLIIRLPPVWNLTALDINWNCQIVQVIKFWSEKCLNAKRDDCGMPFIPSNHWVTYAWHYLTDNRGFVTSWRFTGVALQPRLGLLSERRLGIDCNNPVSPFAPARNIGPRDIAPR